MSRVGSVAAIWRYPVKSLAGELLDEVEVTAGGLAGDRTRALVVRHGHARTGQPYRGKENSRLHLSRDPAAGLRLGDQAGVALELCDDGAYFDAAPVSVLVDRWLEALSAHLGYRAEPQRFRPNFFVHADPEFSAGEGELVGAIVTIGEVRMRVRKPIERCVVITYDPHGAPSDPRVLRYVAQQRNTWMGIYCDVLEPGTARAGDALVIA